MDFEEIMRFQSIQKKNVDSIGMNYLFGEDVEVCDYVVSQLSGIDIDEEIKTGKSILLEQLIEMCLNEMECFGDIVQSRVCGLTSCVPICYDSKSDFEFGTDVSYVKGSDGTISKDSGVISTYIIPKNLFEISVYHFGHEQMHALKETNYEEYVDNITLGEVIPLFYELMIFNPNEVLKRELLRFRISYLLDNKMEYLFFDDLFRENRIREFIYGENKNLRKKGALYEYIRSRIGGYLNSFYYAIILYSMYKETPNKILSLVSKVLNQEMTTLQMLELLDLYGDIRGEIFEKEFEYVKKHLK